ncbi:hypothetical protein TNIN_94761 [Trichonephila inaurata madagascariensis]|uniref:Uncharacterized protein n=1 Tax=Trichonephila inaurata madagascariensis TaxID=2747483 RepID=A0A8X6YH09_9ARAC|nr:hypothetical protein TNIN_94761 [Trichonephila inaurata madagascariensis]
MARQHGMSRLTNAVQDLFVQPTVVQDALGRSEVKSSLPVILHEMNSMNWRPKLKFLRMKRFFSIALTSYEDGI